MNCNLALVTLLASEPWGYEIQTAEERIGDPPLSYIHEPLVVRDRDVRQQEDPMAVHCFCVCSSSTLLGDLEASRSVECDFLSVLSIYLRILSSVLLVVLLRLRQSLL